MLKTILSQVKEFKRVSILTPVFVLGEVILEMVIPLLMASIIDEGVTAGNIDHIKTTGLWMLLLAVVSLCLGLLSAGLAPRPQRVWHGTFGRPCLKRFRPIPSPTLTSSVPPA